VSPLAAFLFTIFLMFFVFALVGEQESNERPPNLAAMEAGVSAARQDVVEAEAELAETKADLADVPPGAGMDGPLKALERTVDEEKKAVAEAEADLATERARIDGLRAALVQLDKNEAAAGADVDPDIFITRQIIESALADPQGVSPGVVASIAPDGVVNVNLDQGLSGMKRIFEQIREANADGSLTVNTGMKGLDKKLKAKLENPELAWYKIENTAYKFSFLLLPISLPFLWIMFAWKKGVTLFDHSVFILYSLTFMSLLFILIALLGRGPEWLSNLLAPWLVLAPPVHMYFQLKGGYQLGWFSALWRTIFLIFSAFICLALFLIAITMVGLLG
jgi:hypothetical protein